MDILELLTDEHRQVEQMIGALESAETVHDRESILVDIGEALAKHMDVEEERVYPLIETRLAAPDAQRARDDHDATRRDLAAVVDATEDDDFAAAVAEFKAGIARHVANEEGQLFPMLRRAAAAEIDALGDGVHVENEVQEELTDETLAR